MPILIQVNFLWQNKEAAVDVDNEYIKRSTTHITPSIFQIVNPNTLFTLDFLQRDTYNQIVLSTLTEPFG